MKSIKSIVYRKSHALASDGISKRLKAHGKAFSVWIKVV